MGSAFAEPFLHKQRGGKRVSIPFQEEIIALLFEPEGLFQFDLNQPNEYKKIIKAYGQLEYEEGFIMGVSLNQNTKDLIERTVTIFIQSIRMNKTEELLYMYQESKESMDSLRLFMISFHKANKILHRYKIE